jgi:hypothetical protein
MKENKGDLARDKQPQQPTNIVHLLPFFSPAVASMAGKGAEALLKYVQSPDAVFVQVSDSKQIDNRHHVQFRVTNNTLHGLYVESAVLAEPGGNSTITEDRKALPSKMTFGEPESPRPPMFPRLLDSGGEWFFDVEFPLGDEERKMKWDSAGRLELIISRLDQSKSEKKEVTFLIRWSRS